MTGLETAETLQSQGCDVSIVEMRDTIGPEIYIINRMDILNRINQKSGKLFPGHKLIEIQDNGVILTNVESDENLKLDVDHVVLSLGVQPDKSIADTFDSEFSQVISIGDSKRGGRIYDALNDGYKYAYSFENK